MGQTPFFKDDSEAVWVDFRIPQTAIETRMVGASVLTFSSSLSKGVPYILTSDGAPVYVTFTGVTPVITPGTGSQQAIPIMNGEKFPFMVGDTGWQIKALTSGSTPTTVTLMKAVASSSMDY